ncbi:serglycin-like [Gadus chalcogrammus]|uniref:serglycin n=1 Tax=Gadus chalcogrammus TaxID=1042646 RepID=UPI0024C4AC14|nr:serglycin [Gadus chalcogrammus]XP_056463792.1 serglycin-like [Gadus chalcogrammus]
MKIFLSLAVICFAINSGTGAPSKARYMFVKCHPLGNDSNCVTHQGPEMNLTTDLPDKLPASAAPYIGAQPVEDGPVTERKEPKVESVTSLTEDGSGVFEGSTGFEGSAVESPVADGSGDFWTQLAGDVMADYRPAEEELREDHLLDL